MIPGTPMEIMYVSSVKAKRFDRLIQGETHILNLVTAIFG
jgi:hypothetical protein